MSAERQRGFADALLGCKAKFGAFRLKLHETLPEAPLSPIYLDLRVLQSFPDAMDAAVAALGGSDRNAGAAVYATGGHSAGGDGAGGGAIVHGTRGCQ